MKQTSWHRVITLLFVCILLFFASATQARADIAPDDSNSILVPIFNSEEERSDYFKNKIEHDSKSRAINETRFFVSIARNGNTTSCHVQIHWTGLTYFQGVRFRQMKVSSTSSLNPVQYDSIGSGSIYRTFFAQSASIAGSIPLEAVSIPVNVDTVLIKTTDFQAYNMSLASWISSAYPLSGLTDIN